MLGYENCLPNSEPRGDMMSMSGPGPCMPMGAMPPNYGMPRGGEAMFQGMVSPWHAPPGQYGGHPHPHAEHQHHGMTPDMGMPNMPVDKYELPPVSPPPQRERFSYTRYQLELLNSIYLSIRYPNSMQKQLIAKRVGITRDQVKIWFQNRRRKDVVGKHNPGKAAPPEEPNKAKMVPDPVMQSIVDELLKYENDPKGKKIKEAMERSKRSTQAHKRQKVTGSSPESDVGSVISSEAIEELLESPKYQPQGTFPLATDGFGHLGNPYAGGMSGGGSEKSPASGADSFNSAAGSPDSLPSPPREEERAAPAHRQPEEPVPTSEQLDMLAPPNTEVPSFLPPHGIKRSHSDESLEDISDDEAVTSPAVVVQKKCASPPPNQVAPPSEPIKFSAHSAFTPTKPLAIHIPHAAMKSPPTAAAVSQSEPAHDFAHMTSFPPMQWGVTDNGQVVRDTAPGQYGDQSVDPQAYYMGPPPSGASQSDPTDPKSLNVNSVFPFPLMAEPPRMMSSIASYPDAYAHAHTMVAGGYQPMMISSFNNPYYGYDASSWSGYQDKQQMAKN